MEQENPEIQETVVDAEHPAGVPDGTVLETVEDGEVRQEVIVNDLDENGNIIGWHKEVV